MPLIRTEDILSSNLRIEIFPFIVQDIAHLIGIESALRLVERYQGTDMWVPDEYRPNHVLEQLVGETGFKKLIEKYGAESHEIPKCDAAIRTVRNKLIRESTRSQRDLGMEWKLTTRQIRNIQNGTQHKMKE